MGVTTKRYVRKPLYVDAVRITTENFEEIASWCDGKIQTGEVPPGSGKEKTYIKVQVVKPMNVRQTMAFVGDWLLKQGDTYKIYTNKAFKLAFDEVDEQSKEAKTQPPKERKDDLPPQPRRVGGNVRFEDKREKPKEIKDAEIKSVGPVAEEPNPETGVQPIESVTPQPSNAMQEAVEQIEADGGTVEPATPEAIAEVVTEQQPEVPVDPALLEDARSDADPEEQIVVEDSPTAPPVEEDEDRPVGETPIAPPPTPAIVPPEPEPDRLQVETGGDRKIKHEPVGPVGREHDGKRVLTEHEQRVLGPDEVRKMVRAGEVILAQDLVEQS